MSALASAPTIGDSRTKSLQGKVALVTGGSRGIGAAIVRRLAREGAHVALTYNASPGAAEGVAAAVREEGVEAEAIRADAADAKQIAGLVRRTIDRFGRLDILVNNAGIAPMGPIEEFSEEEFDRLVDVNVKAVFLASREAAKVMPEGGRIITIGSSLGSLVPLSNISVYAMTKFAVQGLTRGMARDLGPRGITVNVVQPGPVDTDMNPASSDAAPTMAALTALRRYGKPEEVAELVAFVASPGSSYITGAALTVDGGASA